MTRTPSAAEERAAQRHHDALFVLLQRCKRRGMRTRIEFDWIADRPWEARIFVEEIPIRCRTAEGRIWFVIGEKTASSHEREVASERTDLAIRAIRARIAATKEGTAE